DELHRQMQQSLSGGQRRPIQSQQQRRAASTKSVSQLSGRQNGTQKKRTLTSKAGSQQNSIADDKQDKMRQIKESMNRMDNGGYSSNKRSSAPSSTAAEAQRYVQRQSSQVRQRHTSASYDYEIPRDYRQNLKHQQEAAAAARKNRTGIILVFAAVMLLIVAYVIGMLVCSKGFLPNTYVNGVNISGMTMDEATTAVIHEGEVQGLTFVKKSGEEIRFTGEEFGSAVTLANDTAFKEAASQNTLLWFKNYFKPAEYTVQLVNTYDEDRLEDMVRNYTWGSAPPTDAYLQKQPDGMYEIVPEDNGDMIDVGTLVDYTLEQVRNGITTIELEACECYLPAEVTAESLTDDLEKANAMMGLTITYDFEDRQEVLESSTIVEWVSSGADGELAVDENAVKAWVQTNLADKYDTFVAGYTRTFKSTLQGTIEVPLGAQGIYGWKTDVSETTAALIELIKVGESATVEPVYTMRAYSRAADDIGDTYVEVDITNQHIWFYKNGSLLMDSDCVTGTQTNPDRATPTGVFKIWTREREVVLKGEGYAAPVDYWMNVSWCGVGLHDLNRAAYGGDIYMYNGSHGCINLPPDFAEDLFYAVEVNTPVFIIP
ncbi:MAG: L,D-transpeptidase family protein, partial [Oscillospiraceae bacterium]|nr:L,D-transpeptidase family protein [Oscillospiraceae bacterium]